MKGNRGKMLWKNKVKKEVYKKKKDLSLYPFFALYALLRPPTTRLYLLLTASFFENHFL
jgi:hypothetical protein